ncbi:MAG: FUSC family protein [Woeseiaceae bacterium]
MSEKDFSKLSDEALLAEAKKMKSEAIISAFLIGFMVGVFFYGLIGSGFGFFALLPLFLAFKVFHKPENNEARATVTALLNERGLT